jgi:hypothetical protein
MEDYVMRFASLALSIFMLLTMAFPAQAQDSNFTEHDVDTGKLHIELFQKQGKREVHGSSAYWTWYQGWYSMTFDHQRRIIDILAGAEVKASRGAIDCIYIEYNGDTVAKATPTSGVKVVKHRP